jgi:hypothetical protein
MARVEHLQVPGNYPGHAGTHLNAQERRQLMVIWHRDSATGTLVSGHVASACYEHAKTETFAHTPVHDGVLAHNVCIVQEPHNVTEELQQPVVLIALHLRAVEHPGLMAGPRLVRCNP